MPLDNNNIGHIDDIRARLAVKSKAPNFATAITLKPDQISQYDTQFEIPIGGDWESALGEYKAQQQPGIDQLANGLVKGAVLAGTTFADTFGGTLSGVLNMALNGSEQGYLNAFVKNPFSNAMQDINDASEKAFANYRTKAEQEMDVFEQMFSAKGAGNFWGDMFIKNLGFAGGAMAAGYVSGALFSGLTQGVRARQEAELFKKMTKNVITKDARSVEEGIQMLANAERTGLLNVEATELKQLLEDSGKAYRNLNRANQLTSSALAATGEARIEALGNGRQFQEAKLQELNAEFKNPDGTFKAGKTQEEYNNKLNQLDDLVKGFQNSEFLINTALLTASNFIGYRNFFAKDYGLNAGRFDDLISINSIKNITAGEDIAKLIQSKWYSTLGKSLMGSGREGLEEFFQTVTQKSADNYYSAKFNGIDPDAFTSLAAGMNEAMGKEGLESFILGAMTGLIMPGGGLISEFKQAKQLNKDAAERVADLNNSVKAYVEQYKTNPESVFMNFYDMINRDVNLNKAQLKALLDDDKYTYENLKNDKFYNMASAFINAGKYNDLVDILEEETKLSADDLRVKYSVPTDPADPNSPKKEFFKNWEDHEIKTYIANQSKKNTNAVKNIRDLMNNIESRYGKQLALIKTEDGTKKVEIKNILARHLFLGETLDRRLTGVHNELLKQIALTNPADILGTDDSSIVTDFINNISANLEQVNDENFKKVLNNFEKLLKNSSDPKKMVELFTDYIQLAGDRKAHNAAWIRLTENSFTNLLNRLQTEDQKQAEKNIEQTNKELNDEEKINIVREKAKAAGYSGVGNYFTITDNNGNVKKYELEPITNLSAERKKLRDEFDSKLSQLDPNDTASIKTLEDEYKIKEEDLVNNANQVLIKDFDTGEYLLVNNKLQKFDNEFAKSNYNKIQFVSKEQAISIKRAKTIQDANRRKIDAIRQVLLELNKGVNANLLYLNSLNNEKSSLENEIDTLKKQLNTLDTEESISQVINTIKKLNSRLNQLNTAIEAVDKIIFSYNQQKENLTTLALEIKEAFEKVQNFSIDEFVSKMTELNVESADKIKAKNLAKDLQELADTTEIDESLYNLNILKNNLEIEISTITETINSLEEALAKSEAYKEWVLASKIDELPKWFVSKWKIEKVNSDDQYLSRYDDLRDLKKLYKFQNIVYKYAKDNNISVKEAFEEYINDNNQLKEETNLNRTYDEIKNINNDLLISKADLENLKSKLADVIDIMEFNKRRSLINTIQKEFNNLKTKYTDIVNQETKDSDIIQSQLNDTIIPPVDDITIQDNNQLNESSSAKSSTPFYTTNKTILQRSNGETDYDSEGYPKTNPNDDAIRWNTFLEVNPDLSKNFALQAFILQDLPKDSPLKIAALERIKQGGGTPSGTDIVVALVDNKTGELIEAGKDGVVNSIANPGLVYTFLPLTDQLLIVNNKINYAGLLDYFKKFSNIKTDVTIEQIKQGKSADADQVQYGENQPKITLAEFKQKIREFAASKHSQFISDIIKNIKSGNDVFIPIKGITNGILVTKKSDAAQPISSVSSILKQRRGISTETSTGLDNIEVFVINEKVKSAQFQIPGTSIIINNPKLGAAVIYNKVTQEYFYATQRNINDQEIDLIFHFLNMVVTNPKKNLDVKIKIGGKTKYYLDLNNTKITSIDLFKKQGTISLMNNLIHWGGNPKSDATKHTIYINKGRIFYPNPNNNFALESISLTDINNPGLNQNLRVYLKTKRFNINANMMNNKKSYSHPILKNGGVEWVDFAGYKDMLLNGNPFIGIDPILITNAIDNNNSNYKDNKLLFASKNIIIDVNSNGLPNLMTSYKKTEPNPNEIVTVVDQEQTSGSPQETLGFEFTPTATLAPTAPVSDIEARKADIERRIENDKKLLQEAIDAKEWSGKENTISMWKTSLFRAERELKDLIEQEKDPLAKDKQRIRDERTNELKEADKKYPYDDQKEERVVLKNEINAKYDAQTDALEEKPTETPVATLSEETITYTPKGKTKQTYTIKGNQIFNSKGQEVFKNESVDRTKILTNLKIKNKQATVVDYKDTQYVVDNNTKEIVSVVSGKVMQWGAENGDRKAIIQLAEQKTTAQAISLEDKAENLVREMISGGRMITQMSIEEQKLIDSVSIERKIEIKNETQSAGPNTSNSTTNVNIINQSTIDQKAAETETICNTNTNTNVNPNINPNAKRTIGGGNGNKTGIPEKK